jgi:CPA2 family monovalent cation:H+ antiporter-2
VVAIDDRDRAVQMVEYVRRHYPRVRSSPAPTTSTTSTCSQGRRRLAVRELFDASLETRRRRLLGLGMHPFKVEKMSRAFRRHDLEGLDDLYELWDEDTGHVQEPRLLAACAPAHAATLTMT